MNSIAQDMKYQKSLMKYAEKYSASRKCNKRQRGYTCRPESLFRVMRETGMFPAEKLKNSYKSKSCEQMSYPGQRIQVEVKVVPRRCIANPEQSAYSSADFLRKMVKWFARRGINSGL